MRNSVIINGRMKKILKGDFFDIELLLQPDLVFDSGSNGCNFSSLAPSDGEKKLFSAKNWEKKPRLLVTSVCKKIIENIFFLAIKWR